MRFSVLVGATFAASAAAAHPDIFLIRHAEKNRDGTISAQGMKREQCLIDVFGRDSQYNIQKIITPNPHPGSKEQSTADPPFANEKKYRTKGKGTR